MRLLIDLMVYLGSALMVYNIIRYGAFVKTSLSLESGNTKSGILVVPLGLLLFFLIGYLGVGISGIANLLIASILFGGSVFVFLLLSVMYSIVGRIRETDKILSARYEEMKEELNALTQNSLAVFRVNLTKDEIEERAGDYLYESDYATDSYSEMLAARAAYVIDTGYAGMRHKLFTREGLIQHYLDGQTHASEVILARRSDGEISFVSFEATLTKKPLSGEIVAFIVERLHNEEVVRQTLLESVLMNHYDRIAYLIDGKYFVLISNDGKKKGLLLPPDVEDTYESMYLNYILPALQKQENVSDGKPNPLRLSVVDKVLAEQDYYEVDAPFLIEGELRYKKFSFYRIDSKAKFYLMLLSDSTAVQEAQRQNPPETAEAPQEDRKRPESEPETPAIPEDNAPQTEPEEAERPRHSGRLLLVDDNAVNREIAELMLSAEGYEIEQACDGAEAVEKFTASEPGYYDLILMDVQMPVLNGYEATKKIRALPDPKKAAIPIIALTANAYQGDQNEATEAGMNTYATKPFDPDKLAQTIEMLLHGQ